MATRRKDTSLSRQASTFDGLAREVGARKADAARARREGKRDDVEAPKEVFDGFCARLAEAFAPDGFRYSKSRRAMTKTVGDVELAISFATSHHNIAGSHVDFNFIVALRSAALAAWRAENPSLGHADRVAGGMFHLIRDEHMPIHWELAPASTRAAVAEEVERAIREEALPWSERFRDLRAAVALVKKSAVPAFGLVDAIDVACRFASTADALAVIDAFVARGDAWRDAVPDAEARLAALPELPDSARGFAEQAVWYRRVLKARSARRQHD